jgi:hypothetical protein
MNFSIVPGLDIVLYLTFCFDYQRTKRVEKKMMCGKKILCDAAKYP